MWSRRWTSINPGDYKSQWRQVVAALRTETIRRETTLHEFITLVFNTTYVTCT